VTAPATGETATSTTRSAVRTEWDDDVVDLWVVFERPFARSEAGTVADISAIHIIQMS
jgi:hypothetical protein